MHLTQSNHTQRLTRIEDALVRVDETLGSATTTLSSVSSALARMDADFRGKLDMIVVMLDRLTPPADEP